MAKVDSAVIVGCRHCWSASIWAATLRKRETIGSTNIPLGWALSVPLAALNGALACGLLMSMETPQFGSFVGGMLLGATFGIMLWAPGLVLVLLLFGIQSRTRVASRRSGSRVKSAASGSSAWRA